MGTKYLIPAFIVILIICAFSISMTGFFTIQMGDDFSCRGCNLVIITIDTLRADHLSSYGYFQQTSPNMDSFAEDSVTFKNAFSQIPHTPPSHWSIFSGLYAHNHNKFLAGDNGTGIVTLPYILEDNGYTTSGFISSKILKGFTEEFNYFNGHTDREKYKEFLVKEAGNTTRDAISWLEDHSNEKFFLWVHYFDPHSPYEPPGEYDIYNYTTQKQYSDSRYGQTGISDDKTIREDIAKYDGEIRYTDENVGILLERLEELNLGHNTVVVILSDHGECFGEHNFSDFGYEEDKSCVFHGKTLYDEEIHVPLIIKNPRSVIGGSKIEDIVETVDILPTMLDMLGLESELQVDGKSLVPLIESTGNGKEYTISQTMPKKSGSMAIGIRDYEWKFVGIIPSEIELEKEMAEQEGRDVDFTENSGAGETGLIRKLLFKIDEGEGMDMLLIENDVAGSMENELSSIISISLYSPAISIDENAEKLLRSLGYVV